jgi:hypothetical protein
MYHLQKANKFLVEKKLHSEFKFAISFSSFVNGEVDFRYQTDIQEYINEYIPNCTISSTKPPYNFPHLDYTIDRRGNEEYVNEYQGDPDEFNRSIVSTFECKAFDIPLTVSSIKKIFELFTNDTTKHKFSLDELYHFVMGIYYDNMSDENYIWVFSQLALDETAQKLFLELNEGRQRQSAILKDLKQAIEDFDFKKISENIEHFLDGRMIQIYYHDGFQGSIKDLFKKIIKYVDWVSAALDKKEINGMQKLTYLKGVVNSPNFRTVDASKFEMFDNTIDIDTIYEICKKIIMGKLSILIGISKNVKVLEQIIEYMYSNNALGYVLDDLHKQYSDYPQVINNKAYKYLPEKMYKYVDSETIYNTEWFTIKCIVINNNKVNDAERIETLTYIVERMNPDTLKEFQQFFTVLAEESNFNLAEYLMSINNEIGGSNSYVSNLEIIELYIRRIKQDSSLPDIFNKLYNKLDDTGKLHINDELENTIYACPEFLKYFDTVSLETILSVMSYSMRKGTYDTDRSIILDSGKISEENLKKLENKFTEYYQHDLNDELEYEK